MRLSSARSPDERSEVRGQQIGALKGFRNDPSCRTKRDVESRISLRSSGLRHGVLRRGIRDNRGALGTFVLALDAGARARIGYDSAMTVLTKPRMTVDEYLAWAEGKPDRYELHDGVVRAMSPENAGHAEMKGAVYRALVAGIDSRGLPCHALPDGMTVRIDARTAYEPDALVYCGPRVAPSSVEIPDPVIIVEVLSPSTRAIDTSVKLAGYFRVPSVAHYLIVDPAEALIVHHARGGGDAVVTRIVRAGTIALDPPGLELAVADIYGT
jgi:Uma2 family endonuclease